MQSFEIGVFYHVFYEDSIETIVEELNALQTRDAFFFFNIVDTTPGKEKIKKKLKDNFKDSIVVFSSDKGKDVGGKLLLVSIYKYLDIKIKYFLFLHDKKSLHALNSKNWKNGLFKIVNKKQVASVLNLFETDGSVGIIASAQYVIEEDTNDYELVGRNAEKLTSLTVKYSVMPTGLQYVAGTIFWARSKPITDFFSFVNPLEVRSSLEDGNVLDNFSGTYTHSWERLLSWIVTSKGYKIKGI